MDSFFVCFRSFSLNLDKFSIAMSKAICEITSKSFRKTPYHSSFSMTFIILILSAIKYILWPIKLTYSLHFPFLPLTAIAFSIEPCIRSLPIEFVVFEAALVALEKFDSSVMLEEEILIIYKPCLRKFRIFPLQLLF